MRAPYLTSLIALPFILSAPAPAQEAAKPEEAKPAIVHLAATLTGANEVDAQGAGGKGDSDGTGSFSAKLDPKERKLCYTLTSTGIDDPTMAHIHAGAAGVNGPVTVGLPDLDAGEHCQDIDKERADQITAKPGDFYVNIHNGDFPGGAVRGQLTKKD